MFLKSAAGWNQTPADWLALLSNSPDGCFGIEEDGHVVSTATAVTYPSGLGWVGMVLTHPEYRGRGYATALLERTLRYMDELGVTTAKLDATVQGEPLYRKLGFVPEAPIERWVRPPAAMAAAAGLPGRYTGPLTHAAIPMDAIAECEGAWAAGRPGSNAWFFGPCYGLSDEAVESVARTLIAPRALGPVAWDLFPAHPAARVAGALGFAPARRLLRMLRGQAVPTPPEVYAMAGFEWG